MPFELNCGYYFCILFEEYINPRSWSKIANKLLTEEQKLMTVCWKNLHHVQKLQKQAQYKGVKLKSYAPNDKVWLNRKYIKSKQN